MQRAKGRKNFLNFTCCLLHATCFYLFTHFIFKATVKMCKCAKTGRFLKYIFHDERKGDMQNSSIF